MRKILLITITILWYGVGIFASTIRRSTDGDSIVKLPLFKRLDYDIDGTTQYLGSVWTDGDRYDMKIDTTSADTWAWSDLQGDSYMGWRRVMSRNRSPAFGNTQRTADDEFQPTLRCKKDQGPLISQGTFDFENAIGLRVKGTLGRAKNVTIDSMTVKDALIQCVSSFTSINQYDTMEKDFQYIKAFDGVLGLAPAEANHMTPRFFIPPRIFDKAFGDAARRMITVDLYDDFHWKEPLSRVVINTCECENRKDKSSKVVKYDGPATKWQFNVPDGQTVILDSTKTAILGTAELVEAYYKDIKDVQRGEKYWVPCNATMKPLSVPLENGNTVVVDGKFLIGDKRNMKSTSNQGYCAGGLQLSRDNKNRMIYGIPFFRSQTICFTEIHTKDYKRKSDNKWIRGTASYKITMCDKPK